MTVPDTPDETDRSNRPNLPERADPKLLELLVCPLTRTTLIYDDARQELISRAAGLAYPIRNGVPMMVADVARALDDGEVDKLRGR